MNVKPYVYAISAVSVALAAIYISRGLNTQLHFLSPTDGERLKEVFLGNQSTWAILCHDNLGRLIRAPPCCPYSSIIFAIDGCCALPWCGSWDLQLSPCTSLSRLLPASSTDRRACSSASSTARPSFRPARRRFSASSLTRRFSPSSLSRARKTGKCGRWVRI